MKAIVCGGRNFGRTSANAAHLDASDQIKRASAERQFLMNKMSELHTEMKFCEITGGNEGGAERLGTRWAEINKIPVKIFERRNRRETIVERNSRMLAESSVELLIAFGTGESTTMLLNNAKKIGLAILEFDATGYQL
jgi:YspA, cpYpsA-related SLOG family